MDIRTTVLTAAAVGVCIAAAPAARADHPGILACQVTLSQFADDVVASKSRLSDTQLHQARQLVDIGRGQCRSSPQIVQTDVRSARTAMRLPSGGTGATYAFSDFWPAPPQDLAELTR